MDAEEKRGGWRKKVREEEKKRERDAKEKKKETDEGCRLEGDRDEPRKAMDQWKLIRVPVHRKNQPTHTQSLR